MKCGLDIFQSAGLEGIKQAAQSVILSDFIATHGDNLKKMMLKLKTSMDQPLEKPKTTSSGNENIFATLHYFKSFNFHLPFLT